jgi:hypothetical protein
MTGTKMLNPMYSIATDGTIAYAEQIKDESRNKFQKEINDEQAATNAAQALTNQANARDIKKALAWAAAGMVL